MPRLRVRLPGDQVDKLGWRDSEAIAVQTREEIEVLSRAQEAVAGADATVATDLSRLIAKKRASLPED